MAPLTSTLNGKPSEIEIERPGISGLLITMDIETSRNGHDPKQIALITRPYIVPHITTTNLKARVALKRVRCTPGLRLFGQLAAMGFQGLVLCPTRPVNAGPSVTTLLVLIL